MISGMIRPSNQRGRVVKAAMGRGMSLKKQRGRSFADVMIAVTSGLSNCKPNLQILRKRLPETTRPCPNTRTESVATGTILETATLVITKAILLSMQQGKAK